MTKARTVVCWFLVVFYLVAGILHIYAPGGFLLITPSWVPFPSIVIFASGVFEIVAALALLTGWRQASAYLLAAYAVAVFPANIVHAFYHIRVPGLPESWWYHAPRLALQPVLVWATLFAVGMFPRER